jgi:hypothetical protein
VGLDVYVGSLTRYYAGDWETVVEQAAREGGFEVQVVRPEPDGDALADPDEITQVVVAWRDALSDAVGQPLDWVEGPAAPYFTDKPAWDGYGSLQVLAACVERDERKRPKEAVEDWAKHKAWKKATKADQPRFASLYFPELWLPVALGGVLETNDAAGNDVMIGSSVELLADLRAVNDASFGGSADELAQWRYAGAEPGGPFDETAKFGLAVFLDLSEQSVAERLPMRLDY